MHVHDALRSHPDLYTDRSHGALSSRRSSQNMYGTGADGASSSRGCALDDAASSSSQAGTSSPQQYTGGAQGAHCHGAGASSGAWRGGVGHVPALQLDLGASQDLSGMLPASEADSSV